MSLKKGETMDVYLLGAGFSSDAGVPTMKNFVAGIRQAAAACAGKPVHRVLVHAARYAEEAGTDNIEELLNQTLNHPVFFDLIWAFGITVNHFSRRFLDRCEQGGDLGWYEDFAALISSSAAVVLTLNYDLVLEEVLWWRTGCAEDYKLRFSEIRHLPDVRQSRRTIPVYKLHGSVSWLWCLACRYTVNRYRHVLSSAFEETSCPRCGTRLIPMLVPPTFRKAVGLAAPLQDLWQEADRLFRTADRLIVGGLSFAERDADFRERFLQGAAGNRSLKEVVIVNRDAGTGKAIGDLLPKALARRYVPGFPQFCHDPAHKSSL